MKIPTQLLQKLLVRYAKEGPAIYHSHHDMIRFWERAVKRAGLPIRLTQGFNPHPRLVFPHALGLGIASRHEALVLEMYDRVDCAALVPVLRHACETTLEILAVEDLPPVKKSLQITGSAYRITGWSEQALRSLQPAIVDILAMESIIAERGAPGEKRRVEIRPYLAGLRLNNDALELRLKHTPTGSARPDEIAALAAERTEMDAKDLAVEKIGMTLE